MMPLFSVAASKSRKSRAIPLQDSKSDRTGDLENLATSQSHTFVEGTTPYAKPAAQINIIQFPDAVTEALKALNGSSPKQDLSPSGQRGQAPQVFLHELTPEIVRCCIRLLAFETLLRYISSVCLNTMINIFFARMLFASLLRKDKFRNWRLHHPLLTTMIPLAGTSAELAPSWLHSSS